MLATLVAILGAVVLLYVLIKGHLYLIRTVWRPVWEEEQEEQEQEEPEAENGDGRAERTDEGSDHGGWDEVR